MSWFKVSTVIDRTPQEVWADLRDISSHITWMAEAVEIRFLSDQREGAGTRFECDTKVGPIRLTDIMEVTAWDEAERMGVRHVGLVTGDGDLLLSPTGDGRTTLRWEEDLSFPWWLGGGLGELAGRPVLRWIWKGNLRRLRERLEAGDHPAGGDDPAGDQPAGGDDPAGG